MTPTTVLIAFYILVAVLIGMIVLFIRAWFQINDQINMLKIDYDYFRGIEKINQDYFKRIADSQSKWCEEFDQHTITTKLISEQYDTVIMNQEIIVDHYRKIVDAQKKTNELYDMIYEEFRQCTEELKHIKAVLGPWYIDNPDQYETAESDLA